jgi:hypothetical protein
MSATDRPTPQEDASPAGDRDTRRSVMLHSCVSICMVLVVIALVALMWLSGWDAGKIRDNVAARLSDRLWKVKLEENFRAETLRIASTNGNELTLATHERKEVFERDTVRIVPLLNRAVPFTDRKTMVAFPATYRYHVLLNDPWAIEAAGNTVVIRAPQIRPTLPVAFDSGQVETETKGWWVSGAWATADKEALTTRITEKLGEQAQTKEMLDAVKNECRDSLAKFVKNWLLREDSWREGRFTEIKVLFPDEGEDLLEKMPPVLRLGEENEAPPAAASSAGEPPMPVPATVELDPAP